MAWRKIESGPFAGIETDVDTTRCGACRNPGAGNHVHPPLAESAVERSEPSSGAGPLIKK
jgi:hypothetical protein